MKKDLDRMPTEWEIDQYEQNTQAFSWSFQQDVVTFLRSLHVKGIDINWAIKCILIRQKTIIFDRKERARAKAEWQRKARKCPDCGKIMYLMPVNNQPETMVGGGYKTQWICPNQPVQGQDLSKACGYSELSKRTAEQWFKKLRLSPDRLKKIPHPYFRNPATDFIEAFKPEDLSPSVDDASDENDYKENKNADF